MKESKPMDELVIVLTTELNQENARNLAAKILSSGLAGCVNFYNISSQYIWNEELVENKEVQLFIKTNKSHLDKLSEFISKMHSYENPEIIHWNISSSHSYSEWLNNIVNEY